MTVEQRTLASSEWGRLAHVVRSGGLWGSGATACGITFARLVPPEQPVELCNACRRELGAAAQALADELASAAIGGRSL